MRKNLIILFLFAFIGCDPYDNRLKIINNSSETIFVELSEDESFSYSKSPIVIDSLTKDTLWHYMQFVSPMDSLRIPQLGKKSWEKNINKYYKDSILTVFIFDSKLLREKPFEVIASEKLYSKKFRYKVKDLEKINWRLIFP